MARWLPERLTREQLLTALAALAVAGVLGSTVLLVVSKSTSVEMRLRLDEVSLTVVPPSAAAVQLLHPELEVRRLQWRGAAGFEATLETPRAGRATAQPDRSAVIGLEAGGDPPDGAGSFTPTLKLHRPARLTLLPSRTDRLTIAFGPARRGEGERPGLEAEPGTPVWRCRVLPREGLALRLRDLAVAVDGERLSPSAARLAADGAAVVFTGGAGTAELGLEVLSERRGLTTLKTVDLLRGEVVEAEAPLELELPEERILLRVEDRLLLLERRPVDPEANLVLAPDLTVVRPTFHRRTGAGAESFVRGGTVRFPGGERPLVELEPGFALAVSERTVWQLRRLELLGGELELVLWGRPGSVEAGPAWELRRQLLPSALTWLSTHQTKLIFSVLGVLLAAAVALLRLLGLVGKEG